MTDRHEHLDEGTIHAWLDSALPPDESARVEAQAMSCGECSALVAEARGLIAASSRILSSLDAVPAGVIPGSSGDVDQLAALRARHTSRRKGWWSDRRFVAAASIVFVAGVSSLVWRNVPESARNPVAGSMADAVQPDSDNLPTATTPPMIGERMDPTAGNAGGAPARVNIPETSAPPAAPMPSPIASGPVDSVARKAAASTALSRIPAANEAKLADSGVAGRNRQAEARRDLARAERSASVQQSIRQQGAPTQQQGFRQLRPDTMRVNTPPPTFGARALRAPAVAGAAAESTLPAPSCFRLQALPPVPDSVRLLDETLPMLSDPTWFRAEYVGRSAPPVELQWRQVDSLTIELRVPSADSAGVRFTTDSTVADIRGQIGMRAVIASRITCPPPRP